MSSVLTVVILSAAAAGIMLMAMHALFMTRTKAGIMFANIGRLLHGQICENRKRIAELERDNARLWIALEGLAREADGDE